MTSTAIVYGESGALKDLLERVGHPSITCLDDIARFRQDYPRLRRQKLEEGLDEVRLCLEQLVTEIDLKRIERAAALKTKTDELNQVLGRLKSERSLPVRRGNVWVRTVGKIEAWHRNWKIKRLKSGFQSNLRKATLKLDKRIRALETEIEGIQEDPEAAAEELVSRDLRELDRLESGLDRETPLYYGAIGERDVIQKLSKLPGTYYVINDFKQSFSRPIYNRAEQDRIYSIQIDHVVVGPTGIFVIETKNWSEETILSEAHFSPVKQVRRAGFALFVILNQTLRPRGIRGLFSRSGGKKLSPKQVVVFRNGAPQGGQQFVKQLGIGSLNSYITYGGQMFEPEDVLEIVEFLLQSNTN